MVALPVTQTFSKFVYSFKGFQMKRQTKAHAFIKFSFTVPDDKSNGLIPVSRIGRFPPAKMATLVYIEVTYPCNNFPPKMPSPLSATGNAVRLHWPPASYNRCNSPLQRLIYRGFYNSAATAGLLDDTRANNVVSQINPPTAGSGRELAGRISGLPSSGAM